MDNRASPERAAWIIAGAIVIPPLLPVIGSAAVQILIVWALLNAELAKAMNIDHIYGAMYLDIGEILLAIWTLRAWIIRRRIRVRRV